MEKKNNLWWKAVLIILLAINIAFGLYVLPELTSAGGGIVFFGILPYLLILALIDLTVVFLYVFTQHPQGKARIVSCAVLVPLGLLLALMVLTVIDFLFILNK